MTTVQTQNQTGVFGLTFIKELEAAIKRFNMYPDGHPATKSASELPYNTLKQAFGQKAFVIISVMEGKLAVDGKPLEYMAGKSHILEALNALNLHSISFSTETTAGDIHTFLQYFVGKTGGKFEWNDLSEYLSQNKVSAITVDELRYELVGKDQQIVDADAVIGGPGGGGGAGAAAFSIASLFNKNPELILGLMANKDSARSGISEEFAHAIDFSRLSDDIHSELGEVSEEQILSIIAASLKENITNAQDYDEVDLQGVLHSISDVLEKRNQAEMIPKVKRIFEELHLIDDRYLDLILDKKHSRKRLAFDELEKVRENIVADGIDYGKLRLIPKRLEIYGDDEYIKNYIGDITSAIVNQSENWQIAATGLSHIIESANSNSTPKCLKELYQHIIVQIQNYNLTPAKFSFFISEAAKLIDWLAEADNLELLKDLFDVITVYTSKELMTSVDKKQTVKDFYEKIGTNQLATKFMTQLEKQFERLNRITFSILKHIQTLEFGLRLCEYLDYPDRSIRLFNIRILSEFKRIAPIAFEMMLADRKLFERPSGQTLLSDQQWYRLRNIVLISGNIANPDAIKILEIFVGDPDPRIAEEMILALEKIKTEKACSMLSSYLYFGDSKIRLRAAVALGNVGDEEYLSKLTEAYNDETEVRMQMIPIIARLGKEKSLPFFSNLLMGEKESLLKSFLGKADDELKLQILSALTKIPSQNTLKLLDEFKSSFGKGFSALFKSNRVLVALENTRRAIKSKI